MSYCRHASLDSFCFPYLTLWTLPLRRGCRNPIDLRKMEVILRNLQHKLKDSTWISKNWLVLRSGDETLNCPSVIRGSGWVLSLCHRRRHEIRNWDLVDIRHWPLLFHIRRSVFAHRSFVYPAHTAVYECPVSSHVISPTFILFSRGPECILTDQTRVWCLFAS